jgi:hypothetical protein
MVASTRDTSMNRIQITNHIHFYPSHIDLYLNKSSSVSVGTLFLWQPVICIFKKTGIISLYRQEMAGKGQE